MLDVGCGAGVPITQTLAQRFVVTGVDISGEMIQRARANVPQGSFIHGDIMSVEISPSRGILKGCVNSQAVYPLSEQHGLEARERRYTAHEEGKHWE